MYITKNIMESIPATIAITRPTAKKVKWAFRLKDEVSEEWSEYGDVSAAACRACSSVGLTVC